jgi:putative DNA primase/helicase
MKNEHNTYSTFDQAGGSGASNYNADSDEAESENNTFTEDEESIDIFDTIDIGAASSGSASTSDSTFDTENAEEKDQTEQKKEKKPPIKDSKLARSLANSKDKTLVFDEVSLDWYRCESGLWKPISSTRALKLIDVALHGRLSDGFAMSKLKSIEAFLRLYLAIDKWQTDRDLLPMKNGVLNIKTLSLEPYTPRNKFRWQLPYAYDKGAEINIINTWLNDVTEQDSDTINIIRAFLKITLTGGGIQKFLEIIGPGGTGKSTLIRLVIMLVGESNHAATDLRNLEQNRFEAALLYGKRLAVISDSSRYGGEVSTLKALTGGDPLRLERKNQQQTGSFVFDGVVMIASNEAIQSTDYSSGLARRRMPVIFNKKITDADKEKWRDVGGIEIAMNSEMPALLNWVLAMSDDDLNDVIGGIDGDLTPSQRRHLCETNKLVSWIDDNLILQAGSKVYIGKSLAAIKDDGEKEFEAANKLYSNYFRWCKEKGVQPIAVQRFSTNLEDMIGHLKLPAKALDRDSAGRAFLGFAIRKDCHGEFNTPVTDKRLKNADECRSHDEANSPASRNNVDNADNVDVYSNVEINTDADESGEWF